MFELIFIFYIWHIPPLLPIVLFAAARIERITVILNTTRINEINNQCALTNIYTEKWVLNLQSVKNSEKMRRL